MLQEKVCGLHKGGGAIGFLSVIDNIFWGWNINLFVIVN